jgi:hypothetical protein
MGGGSSRHISENAKVCLFDRINAFLGNGITFLFLETFENITKLLH